MRNERLGQAGTARKAPRSPTGRLAPPRQVDGYRSSVVASAHPLKVAMDEIAMRERFGLLFDEIFRSRSR